MLASSGSANDTTMQPEWGLRKAYEERIGLRAYGVGGPFTRGKTRPGGKSKFRFTSLDKSNVTTLKLRSEGDHVHHMTVISWQNVPLFE